VGVVKQLAESLRLQGVSARRGRLTFRLRQDARIEPSRLIELVSRTERAQFSPSGVLTLEGVPMSELVATARDTLEFLADA
jgi:hypothetical protein